MTGVAIVMRRAAMMPVILGEFGLGLVEAGLGRGVDFTTGRHRRGDLRLRRGGLRDRGATEARSGKAAEKAHHE